MRIISHFSPKHKKIQEPKKLVPLEAHIMSKCPDAKDCLTSLILPVMSELSSHINLTLSYIGKATTHDDGVSCPHGPGECLGDILQLCAAEMYPDPKQWLGFAYCMEDKYQDIPDRWLVEGCANEYGVSFDGLNWCASREDGQHAMNLLKGSVGRSKALGVGTSCTIRLNDEVRCIRDGGEWKDCDGGSDAKDLMRDIEALYEQLNS